MPRPVRNAPIARQADWGEPRFGLRSRGLVPVRSAESFRPGLRAPRLEAQAGRRPPFPVADSTGERTRARPNTNSPTEAPYDSRRTEPLNILYQNCTGRVRNIRGLDCCVLE